jgi:hypothetical protein
METVPRGTMSNEAAFGTAARLRIGMNVTSYVWTARGELAHWAACQHSRDGADDAGSS